MAHAHDHHHHHEDDVYAIDQLCMVGLSGAFGVVCLSLYFWQTPMLNLLLAPQFHKFVVISGFVLLGLAILRAVTLWRGATPAGDHHHHPHNHDHAHDHGHDHAHHHRHGDEPCDDGCGQEHAHGHSHDGHDHGWAPWRYVVMLVPIVLFLLGLPNKGPRAADHSDEEARIAELVRESSQAASLVGSGPWSRIGLLGKIAGDDAVGQVIPTTFKEVLESVQNPSLMARLEGNTVKLRGQFIPDARDPRFFSLVRFQIGCCAGDAVDKRVSVFAREKITDIPRDAWVEVVGKVEYGRRGEATVVRLVTSGSATVRLCQPDVNPYIQ